jgi:DNA-binding response OmpR family regulator
MKILLVEDDANLREVTQRSLEKERYVVEIAADYRTALQKIEDYDYDCILLDIMLPELDGWQVCREIRKKSQCPIIMLTAKGEVFDKVLGLGFVGKVKKNA